MFYQKKKEYSEISESNLNINSDYFNIFQNELKNLFPNNNKNNNKNNDKNCVILESNTHNDIDINTKINCSLMPKKIHKIENRMINSDFKNIELNNTDIFFINMFIKHIKNNNK